MATRQNDLTSEEFAFRGAVISREYPTRKKTKEKGRGTHKRAFFLNHRITYDGKLTDGKLNGKISSKRCPPPKVGPI
jgi:hypothetical protein